MDPPFAGLLPLPRRLRPVEDGLELPDAVRLRAGVAEGPALGALASALAAVGCRVAPQARGAAEITLEVGEEGELPAEGYELAIDAEGARVRGADPAGLAYGTWTLVQLVRAAARSGSPRRLPGVLIEDHPSFPWRGVMLDVSRDRVPTMETLFALVDRLSSWKVNQLQLYTEHTFAYAGHDEVWRGWDPLTPEEIRALDRHCAERHVELVPNQQSFGHMHHWLVHERYRELAECPEGVEHPFLAPDSTGPEPFSLCPTDPRALELLADLYDQLLPCFRSRSFNVGLDETFDLGLGRSAALCGERGVARVYLDFLKAIGELVRARGRRMQFWADIVLNHAELPGLLADLPEDAIPLLWGYEADHPFERETAALAATGRDFLVCPGTSSWQSLAGRFENMVANVAAATHHARANGARGILTTDWGDRGHLQPLPASWPGWIVAADLAWNADAGEERRGPAVVAELLSRHVLDDAGGASGAALVGLARVAAATGSAARNASPLSLLLTQVDAPFPPASIRDLAPGGLERALGEVDAAMRTLTEEAMSAGDRDLVRAELTWTAGILRFAALLGLQRLRTGPGSAVGDVPADARAPLAAELAPLIEEHRRLWLRRSRPGGLERSAAWLERVLARLEA